MSLQSTIASLRRDPAEATDAYLLRMEGKCTTLREDTLAHAISIALEWETTRPKDAKAVRAWKERIATTHGIGTRMVEMRLAAAKTYAEHSEIQFRWTASEAIATFPSAVTALLGGDEDGTAFHAAKKRQKPKAAPPPPSTSESASPDADAHYATARQAVEALDREEHGELLIALRDLIDELIRGSENEDRLAAK